LASLPDVVRRRDDRRCDDPLKGGDTGLARIRVVVAKPGLDGHDRGAKVIARALRDAGMEVIYTGLHQTPEQIVETAIQEDADLVGLSVLSGAHMTLFRKLVELLKGREATDIVVFGGGIIPDDDIPLLESMGVAKIFTPGAKTSDVVAWVRATMGTDTEIPSGEAAPRPTEEADVE
jgi:methylmalonyl-CoA mutase C-terminal domain/subunit